MTSPTDAANVAVERLRAARDKAAQQRAASRKAVEELRERNREESRQLAEQAKARHAGRQPQAGWPDRRQPQTMSLYENDDEPMPPPATARPPHVPQQAPRGLVTPQPRRDDDDWTQESWLH